MSEKNNSNAKTLPEAISENNSLEQQPQIFSHYRILAELGRGGMGIVYKAMDIPLNRIVALKIVAGKNEKNETLRLQREANALAQLEHTNIVRILEAGTEAQTYFSMEYIEGERLDFWIKNKNPGQAKILKIFIKLANALHYAHKKGFLHRDIKPSNIIITEEEEPKIMDFGLAKSLEYSQDTRQSLSKTGDLLGTPSYMSPEQVEGTNVNAKSDVYSLGATLYESLTGKPPFKGETCLSILMKIANDDVVPISKLCPGISPYVEAICMKCLQKNPEKRYLDARQLAKDLQNFLSHRPLLAKPYTPMDALIQFVLRKKMPCILVFCLLLSVTCIMLIFQGEKEKLIKDKKILKIEKINEISKRLKEDAIYKKSPEGYLKRAELYKDMKIYDEAIRDYQTLIEIHDTEKQKAEMYFQLAMLYHFQKTDLPKAISYYKKAIELDPDHWKAFYYRGKLYLYQTMDSLIWLKNSAIDDFTVAISKCHSKEIYEIYADRAEAYCRKGNALKNAQERLQAYQNAMQDFTRVIENISGQVQCVAYCRRGKLYLLQREFEKSLHDLDKAIAIKSDNEEAYYFKGLLYEDKKNFEEAKKNFYRARSCTDKQYSEQIEQKLLALNSQKKR